MTLLQLAQDMLGRGQALGVLFEALDAEELRSDRLRLRSEGRARRAWHDPYSRSGIDGCRQETQRKTLERNTPELAKLDQDCPDMRWCGECDFSTKLIGTPSRPALRVSLRDVQESVLSEAKARLLKDLKLLPDERSLCLVQNRALFTLSLSKGHREHLLLLDERRVARDG